MHLTTYGLHSRRCAQIGLKDERHCVWNFPGIPRPWFQAQQAPVQGQIRPSTTMTGMSTVQRWNLSNTSSAPIPSFQDPAESFCEYHGSPGSLMGVWVKSRHSPGSFDCPVFLHQEVSSANLTRRAPVADAVSLPATVHTLQPRSRPN